MRQGPSGSAMKQTGAAQCPECLNTQVPMQRLHGGKPGEEHPEETKDRSKTAQADRWHLDVLKDMQDAHLLYRVLPWVLRGA